MFGAISWYHVLHSFYVTYAFTYIMCRRFDAQKTARSGLHILLGGICALAVVVFFRFVSALLQIFLLLVFLDLSLIEICLLCFSPNIHAQAISAKTIVSGVYFSLISVVACH